ncbi:MAG: respiratory nitrate reductase subunit gamma, partial [Candidatus Eisenbacteria sp.]|nr:respiratory nitrate reductase subunit gamma [Candidatus Eisenbacteria bacterium]
MLLLSGGAHPAGEIGRELGWNMGGTPGVVIMYLLAVVSLAIFALGLRKRILFWKMGKPVGEGFGDWGRRLWILVRETLFQVQTRRRFLPGLFHTMIFYSFLMLFVATLCVMADMDLKHLGVHIFHGQFYLWISLLADLAGGTLLIGVLIAAVRRYVQKPDFLPQTKPVDTLVLAILAFLVLTGFLAEGARIQFHPSGDPWKAWTPIGAGFAYLLKGVSPTTGMGLHAATWWVHALGTFALIAMIPYTKFLHILSIPTNQFLSRLAPKGSLQRVDIEQLFDALGEGEDFVIGVGEGQHLTWKQRFDLSACIDCGRCDDACPARAAQQPLSPRSLVEDLRGLLEKAAASSKPQGGNGGSGEGGSGDDASPAGGPIMSAVGTVFEDTNFIWHCRSCHACQSICPAGIGHVDLLIELRRARVLMEGDLPTDA